jgi:hypothetical protein
MSRLQRFYFSFKRCQLSPMCLIFGFAFLLVHFLTGMALQNRFDRKYPKPNKSQNCEYWSGRFSKEGGERQRN